MNFCRTSFSLQLWRGRKWLFLLSPFSKLRSSPSVVNMDLLDWCSSGKNPIMAACYSFWLISLDFYFLEEKCKRCSFILKHRNYLWMLLTNNNWLVSSPVKMYHRKCGAKTEQDASRISLYLCAPVGLSKPLLDQSDLHQVNTLITVTEWTIWSCKCFSLWAIVTDSAFLWNFEISILATTSKHNILHLNPLQTAEGKKP